MKQLPTTPDEGTQQSTPQALVSLLGPLPCSQPLQPKILLINDDPLHRKLIGSYLAPMGGQVDVAKDAEQATRLARQRTPDVILLNLALSETRTLALIRAIKLDPTTQHVPLTVLATLEEGQQHMAYLQAGATDVLCKPLIQSELTTLVEKQLREKLLLDKLMQHQLLASRSSEDPASTAERANAVLLICERSDVAGEIEVILRRFDITPVSPTSVADALTHIRTQPTSVILLDNQLANQRSGRLLADLKSHPVSRDIPVVLLTEQRELVHWIEQGKPAPDDYLVQPLEPYELVARIQAALARRTEQQQLCRLLDQLVLNNMTDPLTGLRNRFFLRVILEQRLALFKRQPEAAFALVLLDIDHFREINNRWGHLTGDLVLKRIGSLLRQSAREADVLARYGGEEFMVIMSVTSLEQAITGAQRIRQTIADCAFSVLPGSRVTASLGLTMSHPTDESILSLLQRADEALYQAKKRGRDRVDYCLAECSASH